MFRKAARTPEGPIRASVTETASCQKSLAIHVALEAIAPVRSSVIGEFQKQATVPGFRKGKAPVALVEQAHADSIREEMLRRVMKQAFEQIVTEHQLKPVGPFEVKTATLSETDGLTLEATVEVEPSFALGSYKGIPLTRPSADVSPQELDKALAALQESMAQLVPSSIGETKERRLPVLDDELAKDLGFPNLEQLTQHVEATLREQKRASAARHLDATLRDALITRHPFDVPPRLIAHHTERLTRDFTARLLLSGMSEDQVKAELVTFTEQLRTSAERSVKLSFILDRIATQESVTVTQDELVGRLWQLAQRSKKDPAQIRRLFDERGLWPSAVSSIREEKTLALLVAAASIANGTASADQTKPTAV
ncbi:MAG: trigger factor [Candidatus Omnitrophica bacterium]|nr:trigger factor [Candidatus Omnitrophota bacterium]